MKFHYFRFFFHLLVASFAIISLDYENLNFVNQAKAQQLEGKFQDWSVFKVSRGDKTICYMASIPIKSEGNFYKRAEPFFLVTNIENDADEISSASGFIYKSNSNVEISFGSRKFYLFAHQSTAWANNKSEDIDIIKEMQKEEDFVVSAINSEGKIASDTYSLVGFKQAYKQMKQSCPKN